MSPSDALYQLSEAMVLVMIISLIPITVASVVGLLVSLLQAMTQAQEQTLSFGIKLIAVALTLAGMASFMGSELLTYTLNLFNEFPTLVR